MIWRLLFVLIGLALAPSAHGQSCTTTTCTGAALPSGYLTITADQFMAGGNVDVRPACTWFTGGPNDGTMPAIRNAGFNCIVIGWRDQLLNQSATTPLFDDEFATLSLHDTWICGDNWQLCAPGSTDGRGGAAFGESGDQWWVNPFNPSTPVPGGTAPAPIYSVDSNGLNLELTTIPAGDQAYINAQCNCANMKYLGTLLNSSQTAARVYGYTEMEVAVDKLAGFTFQADEEAFPVTPVWPPEIDWPKIWTDSSGVQWVEGTVSRSSGTSPEYVTSSSSGFDASISHIYGVDWEPTNITFYIDGAQVFQTPNPQADHYNDNTPTFWYLLTAANYPADHGDSGGDPAVGSLPAHAHVKYFRTYSSKPAGGGGPLVSGVCGSLSQIQTCVNNAQSAGLDVILSHIGNEIPTAANSPCWGRQQNGLWFDSGGDSGNDDGCNDGGHVTYTTFKTNTVNLLQTFTGNSSVIGYEVHHEPVVNGTYTGQGGTGGGGGTGQFSVNSSGQIIDPNGAVFVGRGYSVTVEDVNAGVIPPSLIQSLFPRTNYIRLTNFLGGGYTDGITPGTIASWINQVTALGIVVQISDYAGSSGGGCRSGADLTNEMNWLQTYVTMFKSNPFVWFASQNECFDSIGGSTFWNQVNANYNAVRSISNAMFAVESPGGNATPAAFFFYSGVNFATMTNFYIGNHYYSGSGNAFQCTSTQADCDSLLGGWIPQFRSQFRANAEPVIPMMATEQGDDLQTGDPQQIRADQSVVNLSTTSGSQLSGFAHWLWNCNCSTSNLWFLLVQGTVPTNPFGTTTQAQIANAPGTGPTPGGAPQNPGNAAVNWGKGGDTDVLAACEDIGASVAAVNSGPIVLCPGPINNSTTLFSGASRGATNPHSDLSIAASRPVVATGLSGTKVAYSIGEYPNSITGFTGTDNGSAAIAAYNLFWGKLLINHTAPVMDLSLGCSCDGTNGASADDNAWASTVTQYANGHAASGPSWPTFQEPQATAWYAWGYLGSSNPNGALLSDKLTLNASQDPYWSTLLYNQATIPPPTLTVWNANDDSGMTLSGNNLVATSSGTNVGVRSTTSKTTGKVCWETTATTISNNWDVGLSNSSFVLNTNGGGLGDDGNGIGYDPNGPSAGTKVFGVFFNNVIEDWSLTATLDPNGAVEAMCADFDAQKFWATGPGMRSFVGAGAWNNSVSCNPTVASCGVSFSGMTGPYFATYQNDDSGAVATLNTGALTSVAMPSGFSQWDTVSAGTGHPIIMIFGETRRPANDNIWPAAFSAAVP